MLLALGVAALATMFGSDQFEVTALYFVVIAVTCFALGAGLLVLTSNGRGYR